MCGLVGIHLFPSVRKAADLQEIQRLFTRALLSNEERGRAATGVTVIQKDGQYKIFKQPVPASDFVQTALYKRALALIGAETVCLLGHTRMPTKGTRWNNANNHPLRGKYTLGIHNGRIHNDEALFAQMQIERHSEVDSEIVFRLLDQVEPSADNRYLAQVRERIGLLDGQVASLYVDLRHPTRLVAIRRNNLLNLHYEPSLKALFFSSRYIFLRKAFGRSVIEETLKNEGIYLFDAEKLLERGSNAVESLRL